MLKKFRLHNFRTYLNTELDFTQRHLIIGKNNSGKTNLCAALHFLNGTACSDLGASSVAVPGGIREITNWAFQSDTIELGCTCELSVNEQTHVYTYDLALNVGIASGRSQEGQFILRVEREQLTVDGPGFRDVTLLRSDGREAEMLHEEEYARSGSIQTAKTLAPRDATMLSKLYELETNRRAVAFRNYLSSGLYFALSPAAIRLGWRGSTPGPAVLSPLGNNLALVLYQLKNMDERRYRRVIEHVGLIEPNLEAINFLVAPDQVPVPFVALRDCPRASWVGLSDGTLRCLALAFVAELGRGDWSGGALRSPPLIVIEEPENGIYPGQLRAFFDLLEDRAPEAQFVFTSHSPYFINLFDAYRDSVTLLRRNKERTEVVAIPPAEDDPDRLLLAEQYSMELFD